MTAKDLTVNNVLLWVITLGVIGGGFLIFSQNQLHKNQSAFQKKHLERQKSLIESQRQSNLVVLMSSILEKADRELSQSSSRKLSDQTIERIADLSRAFKPYRVFEGDILSERSYSPERGQLLLTLSIMNIDTGTLAKIMLKSSFAGADLSGADLSNLFLKGINLKGANLKEANLLNTNLTGAFLWDANLSGADLRKLISPNADFKRAKMNLVDLTDAYLPNTSWDGADLFDATLRRADLSAAKIKWVNLSGAFMKNAKLIATDFHGTNLTRVNFSESNMVGVNFGWTTFNETTLTNTKLDSAVIREVDWFENLNNLHVFGIKDIQKQYNIVADSTEKGKYLLIKEED